MQDIAVKYSYKMISSLKAINIEIILAIDLKKGKVVKAFAGFRLNYKPLKIRNLDLSDPITLIKKTLERFNIYTNKISANFLLLNFNRCKLSANYTEKKLEKKGIILREMRTYGIDNHLRLTIGNTDENKLFLGAIEGIFKNV